ncbi:hypothetical protein BpHYR1_016096 [Brachionus plicatilis]|uniref:Uncharacterized protein n=1 Tax=Brachionus plicatilis TaxID=10195 RepID=A0A3M7QRD7_BRAPC|nr:hypothetical protein BpHYR1_016096 [Brachionus plicatilis]
MGALTTLATSVQYGDERLDLGSVCRALCRPASRSNEKSHKQRLVQQRPRLHAKSCSSLFHHRNRRDRTAQTWPCPAPPDSQLPNEMD